MTKVMLKLFILKYKTQYLWQDNPIHNLFYLLIYVLILLSI